MTGVDVQRLLEPISDNEPAGPDLEGTDDFQALVIAATGRPETAINGHVTPAEEPDWGDVRDRADSLLTRSKDLQVAILLTEALIRTEDLPGLRDGLSLLHGLLETYWDTVWPELDLDDRDGAAFFRINRLKNLGDRGRVVRPVRRIKLPGTRMLGRFSLSEYEESRRSLDAGQESAGERVSDCEASLMEADLDELQLAADAAWQCGELVRSIDKLVDEKSDVPMDLGLASLAEAVGDIEALLREFLTRRGVSEVPADVQHNGAAQDGVGGDVPAVSAPPPIAGKVSSRADVIRVLDQACQYFDEFEPSSPVPLLLRRAKGLIAKDFISILRDIAPRGIEEAEIVTGANGEE